jgi:N-acetylmuramic acid 6-phosphate (MurNAc-6-P) etherase
MTFQAYTKRRTPYVIATIQAAAEFGNPIISIAMIVTEHYIRKKKELFKTD